MPTAHPSHKLTVQTCKVLGMASGICSFARQHDDLIECRPRHGCVLLRVGHLRVARIASLRHSKTYHKVCNSTILSLALLLTKYESLFVE